MAEMLGAGMRVTLSVFVISLLLVSNSISCGAVPVRTSDSNYWNDLLTSSDNGGVPCAACTIVLTLVDQMSQIHSKKTDQILDELCGFFPPEISSVCTYYVNMYGAIVVKFFDEEFTADDICHFIDFCTAETCRLFPQKSSKSTKKMQYLKDKLNGFVPPKGTGENPWEWLQNLINTLAQKHEPIVDFDGDLFSSIEALRGASWRGRDCDDNNADIHPGRTYPGSQPSVDHNCNGISGSAPDGTSYEDTLCSSSNPLGTIVLGDSAGAHFEVPPEYLTAAAINETTYNNILFVLENEFDLPQRSGYTGYMPTSASIPIDSVYKRMLSRNLCNHRDYQNLGVNGCRSGSMQSNVIKSLSRNQTTDHPALVFFELIGNDVCNPHPSLDHMTTVAEFRTNILASLDYLDANLPTGSHVVFVGLADGRVLWDALHNRTHPIGATYAEVYAFLSCLGTNPCWVWLNSNETIRNAGSQRAAELSLVYGEIMANHTYKHFDMAYYDFPFTQIIKEWNEKGGETWQLIEPVDGFHPNQIANALEAGVFWNNLQRDFPHFLATANPNNAKIQALFGDQGGY